MLETVLPRPLLELRRAREFWIPHDFGDFRLRLGGGGRRREGSSFCPLGVPLRRHIHPANVRTVSTRGTSSSTSSTLDCADVAKKFQRRHWPGLLSCTVSSPCRAATTSARHCHPLVLTFSPSDFAPIASTVSVLCVDPFECCIAASQACTNHKRDLLRKLSDGPCQPRPLPSLGIPSFWSSG